MKEVCQKFVACSITIEQSKIQGGKVNPRYAFIGEPEMCRLFADECQKAQAKDKIDIYSFLLMNGFEPQHSPFMFNMPSYYLKKTHEQYSETKDGDKLQCESSDSGHNGKTEGIQEGSSE